jgi:hypothetical protein
LAVANEYEALVVVNEIGIGIGIVTAWKIGKCMTSVIIEGTPIGRQILGWFLHSVNIKKVKF